MITAFSIDELLQAWNNKFDFHDYIYNFRAHDYLEINRMSRGKALTFIHNSVRHTLILHTATVELHWVANTTVQKKLGRDTAAMLYNMFIGPSVNNKSLPPEPQTFNDLLEEL